MTMTTPMILQQQTALQVQERFHGPVLPHELCQLLPTLRERRRQPIPIDRKRIGLRNGIGRAAPRTMFPASGRPYYC